MKRYLVLLGVFLVTPVFSQDGLDRFEPPPEGKAVVYFFRTGTVGLARPFHFFDGEEYLGIMKGKNYMRHECDPGTHLFWASAENKTFINAELEAGKVYGVLSVSKVGFGSARVNLLVMKPGVEGWKKVVKLVKKKAPLEQKPGYIDDWNVRKPDYTKTVMAGWDSQYKDEREWPTVSKEDYIK